MSKIRFVGLDVHAETIAVAVAEAGGKVRAPKGGSRTGWSRFTKLGPAEQMKACYEAGPTGHVLYWQLT
jgi:hypothetical protein